MSRTDDLVLFIGKGNEKKVCEIIIVKIVIALKSTSTQQFLYLLLQLDRQDKHVRFNKQRIT